MADTTSPLLGLLLMETGGHTNTWGGELNTNFATRLEAAIALADGYAVGGGTETLTADEARSAILVFTGTLTSDQTVVVPNKSKSWIVSNQTTGAFNLLFKTATGSALNLGRNTGVLLQVVCDGANNMLSNTAGTIADKTVLGNFTGGAAVATPVTMAALGAALGYLSAPAGTAMLFRQTTPPVGWTKDTTAGLNDSALRIVTGTAGTGGTAAFSTTFAARTPAGTVGATTLTTSQIPAHRHGPLTPGDTFGMYRAGVGNGLGSGSSVPIIITDATTADAGGGGSHDHPFTGVAMDFAVKYTDIVIATKDA